MWVPAAWGWLVWEEGGGAVCCSGWGEVAGGLGG